MFVGMTAVAIPWLPTPVPRVQAAPPPARPASAADQDVATRFVGSYAFVGGAAQRTAREAAIDDVVSEMNILVQGIARKKLGESTPIAKRLDVSVTDSKISVAFDGREHVATLDGQTTKVVGSQGDELQYRVEFSGDRLRQVYSGDRGNSSNTLRRRDSGRIHVDIEIDSARLPKPLRYRLTYGPR
jgi:hypothetical protein